MIIALFKGCERRMFRFIYEAVTYKESHYEIKHVP